MPCAFKKRVASSSRTELRGFHIDARTSMRGFGIRATKATPCVDGSFRASARATLSHALASWPNPDELGFSA